MNKFIVITIIVMLLSIGMVSGCIDKSCQDELTTLRSQFNQYKENHTNPNPREFHNLTELKIWLLNNDVNERLYIVDDYDCENFAMDLVDDARAEGYLIYCMGMAFPTYVLIKEYYGILYGYVVWEYRWIVDNINNHAFCITKVSGLWYMIEPQTDEVTLIALD